MGGIKLQKLTARRIQQYYNDRIQGKGGTKLSGNTVKKHHILLKTALKLAVKQDVIYKKPTDLAEPPKYTRPEISVYSVEVDETGKPVNPGYLSSRFRKCIVTNELPHITLHGLRHSVASIANEAGVTLFNISKMLGHSSPDVTGKVYIHLFDETNKEAFGKIAKALKLIFSSSF